MCVHHSSVRKKLTHFIVTVFGESWTERPWDMKFSPNVVTKLITKPVPWSKEGNDLILTVGERGPQAKVTTKSPDLAPSFPNGNNENPQEHCCLFKFSNCFCDSLVVCFIWVYWPATVLMKCGYHTGPPEAVHFSYRALLQFCLTHQCITWGQLRFKKKKSVTKPCGKDCLLNPVEALWKNSVSVC